jgi:hypothetical protein
MLPVFLHFLTGLYFTPFVVERESVCKMAFGGGGGHAILEKLVRDKKLLVDLQAVKLHAAFFFFVALP